METEQTVSNESIWTLGKTIWKNWRAGDRAVERKAKKLLDGDYQNAEWLAANVIPTTEVSTDNIRFVTAQGAIPPNWAAQCKSSTSELLAQSQANLAEVQKLIKATIARMRVISIVTSDNPEQALAPIVADNRKIKSLYNMPAIKLKAGGIDTSAVVDRKTLVNYCVEPTRPTFKTLNANQVAALAAEVSKAIDIYRGLSAAYRGSGINNYNMFLNQFKEGKTFGDIAAFARIEVGKPSLFLRVLEQQITAYTFIINASLKG